MKGTKVWFELLGARVKGTFLEVVKEGVLVLVNGKKIELSKDIRIGRVL